MAKRGNGEGTIYKRSDGRYEARISRPGGKRKSFYGATRQEVAECLAGALGNQERDDRPQNEQITLGRLLDEWLESVRPSLRASTLRSYRGHIENHLKPALGRTRVARLQPREIQGLVNEKLDRGLAPRTVELMLTVLNSALSQAEAWGILSRNPATHVKRPRQQRRRVEPLGEEDARIFLEAVEGDRLEALYWVALTLGLRQSEILGLRWLDVDLDRGLLWVRQSLHRAEGEWRFLPPKSEASRRTLALPLLVIDKLRAHRELQEALRLASDSWPHPELVFTTSKGTCLDGRNVTRYFQRHLQSAGLDQLRFHDLRHSAASLLLATGGGLHEVKEILGHSQIGVTVDTYGHLELEAKRRAAERINELFGQ